MWRALRFASLSWAALAVGTLAISWADEPYGRSQIEEGPREHWSFQPLARPSVPAVAAQNWVSNPIDAFIAAELQKVNLQPAGPAPKSVLLRRVYLDLIGLPPSPEELDAFVSDTSATAFERVVDKLLARPEYGQRWARHWLDVVRYAETNGYERDGMKPQAWRFRDWVIDSLNEDMPYDRFLIEQLAGDEVPGSDARSQIGATMLRLGPWDDEPADPLADRYDQLDDIVATTSAAFIGLTLRCARCHDHKFEPFSQKDYTRWLAIFEPLKRPQVNRTELERDLGPHAQVAAQHALVKRLDEQRGAIERETDTLAWQVCSKAVADGRLPIVPKTVTLAATSQAEPQPWRYRFDEPPSTDWILPDFPDAGWKLGPGGFGTQGTAGAVVRTEWNTKAIWLRREFVVPEQPAGTLKLLVQHDEDVEVYLNGVLAARIGGFAPHYREVALEPAALNALRIGRNVLAVHCKHGTGGQAVDVGLISSVTSLPPEPVAKLMKDVPADALAAMMVEPPKRNDGQKKLLAKHSAQLVSLTRELADEQERGKLAGFDAQLATTKTQYPPPLPKGYLLYEEGPTAAVTKVFHRGDPRSPADEVSPGFPAVLLDAPPPAPTPTEQSTGRRLQLARWLVEPQHPLTARVMVNRMWQHHFGEGIVSTENDFGVMGAMPTHPELLDWLASELVAGGWRMKRMHRMMVLSSTYQMASTPNPAAERVDPQGALLWRFRPRRMEAEALRDTILSTSGQLNLAAGGPGIYPKISRAVLETQSRPGDGWKDSPPHEAARRSVYVFVKRTLPVPELEVLDFPSTEETCEQRVVSTVAPQALTLLNGEFIHEQATAFAARLMREAGEDRTMRVVRAYRLALSRLPSQAEFEAVIRFLDAQRSQIAVDAKEPLDSAALDQKALAAFCLVLLNTNEFAYLQ